MSYHSLTLVFDKASNKLLAQLLQDYHVNLVSEEAVINQLVETFANHPSVQQKLSEITENAILILSSDLKVEIALWEKVASRLSEIHPHIIFIFKNNTEENLFKSNDNFPGNYLRQQNTFMYASEEEGKKLLDFLKQNRVVVLEEKEGRDHHALINYGLNLWHKENKKVLPFFNNEKLQSYHEVFSAIYSFLTEIHKIDGLEERLSLLKTTQEKIEMLTAMMHEFCLPVFVFENISSWFDGKGKPHYTYRDVTDWLYKLAGNGGEYLIITNKNVTGELKKLPFYQSKPLDYYHYKNKLATLFAAKKIFTGDEKIEGKDLKKFFENTNGSEVALQLGCWVQKNGKVSLAKLNDLIQTKQNGVGEGAFQATFQAAFHEVVADFIPDEKKEVYALLARFQVPIPIDPLKAQLSSAHLETLLETMPLIEIFEDGNKEKYYYLHPGIRTFFNKIPATFFDAKKAADWHVSQIKVPQTGLAHLKEAFRLYQLAKNDDGIKKTSTALCQHYFKTGNYPVAHHFGLLCYQKFEKDISPSLAKCLALIFKKYSKPEESLFFFKILHEKLAQETPNKKHIQVYNYMSMLYFDMKDLNNYVEFGLKAYKLALELQATKDIYFIGKSLGRFLYLGDEKEGGLKMMQQSYKIGIKRGYSDVGTLELFLREMGEM